MRHPAVIDIAVSDRGRIALNDYAWKPSVVEAAVDPWLHMDLLPEVSHKDLSRTACNQDEHRLFV